MGDSVWTWSVEHQNYYMVTYDCGGQPIYIWASQQSTAPQAIATEADVSAQVISKSALDRDEKEHEMGWHDSLDPSYCIRTGTEARSFFRKGRVFAMLYTEAVGRGAHDRQSESYSIVRYGEAVYSSIRRFVVVSVRNGFVYAIPIMVYRDRGTLKPGCNPRVHTIIYSTGVDPKTCYFAGEYENGMFKDPIEVKPAESGNSLSSAARLRFGKVYPIEFNVKVKDIGLVINEDMSKLLSYHEEEDREA